MYTIHHTSYTILCTLMLLCFVGCAKQPAEQGSVPEGNKYATGFRINETDTVDLEGWEQHYGDRHPDGSLLRPYIVFFGEGVPYFTQACDISSEADIMLVVGTSLNVYPAASLLQYVKDGTPIIFVDPGMPEFGRYKNKVEHVQKKATEGVPFAIDTITKMVNAAPLQA